MKRFIAGKYSLWVLLAFFGRSELAFAQGQDEVQSKARLASTVQTTDYLVPHISTVPANAGKRVSLFVREKVQSRKIGNAPVVLMIAGLHAPSDSVGKPTSDPAGGIGGVAETGYVPRLF